MLNFNYESVHLFKKRNQPKQILLPPTKKTISKERHFKDLEFQKNDSKHLSFVLQKRRLAHIKKSISSETKISSKIQLSQQLNIITHVFMDQMFGKQMRLHSGKCKNFRERSLK